MTPPLSDRYRPAAGCGRRAGWILAAGLMACLGPTFLAHAQFRTTRIGTGGAVGTIVTNPPPPTGSYSVTGGGNDIGGTADDFTFHYLDVSGNFDLRVRVDSLDANDNDTKAGLMVRQDVTPGGRMAYARVTPTGRTLNGLVGLNDVKFALRRGTAAPDNAARELPATGAPAPLYPNAWLRLARVDNQVFSFNSQDGVNWVLLARQDSATWPGGALPIRLIAGLAVSRGPQGQNRTANAQFRSFANAAPFAPWLTEIADQSMPEDSAGVTVNFNIGDLDDALTALTLTVASSNPAVIRPGDVALGGTGAARTATLKPVANANGVARITLTVRDAARSASTSCLVAVQPVNDAPSISNIPNQAVPEDTGTGAIAFRVADIEDPAGQLVVAAVADNKPLVPDANITLGGTTGDRTIAIQPAANQSGRATITVTVTDAGGLVGRDVFTLDVTAVDDPPTISDIPNQTINEDGATAALPFTIGDVDTALASLTLATATTDSTLIPLTGITLSGTGANRTVTVRPAAGRSGSARVTITVTGGTLSANDSFTVTVNPVNDPPTISDIPDQTVNVNQAAGPLTFTVGDPDTAAGQLEVTKGSDNQTLVPDANIVLGGTAASRTVTVTPATDRSGQARITLTVSDGLAVARDTFLLTVRPPGAPRITVQPQPVEADEGASATLIVVAEGTALRYQWRRNGNPIAGATSAEYVIPRLTPDTVGDYSVVVSNDGGSVTSSTASVSITRYDFGDAPEAPYPTKRPGGAAHRIWSPYHLGPLIDAEPDGQPNGNATGDDLNPTTADDEDGVTFVSALTPGQNAQIRVNLVSPNDPQGVPFRGRLDAWIDWNGDGDWTDTGEQIITAAVLNFGDNIFTIPVPADAKPGPTFARFRLSQEGGMRPEGPSNQAGEVEDYQVSISDVQVHDDFGDAPEFTGPVTGPPPPFSYETTLARNGARHTANPQFHLGPLVDAEPDGQPSPDALRDDITPSPDADDEDGVTFLTPLRPGQLAEVEVTATANGRLDAWIDFDHVTSWSASSDRIFGAVPLAPGVNHLSFTVPAGALLGNTYARFRFSREGKLDYRGHGGDGEVEDYQVEITQPEENLDFGDAPERDLVPGVPPPPFSYETTLARNGARHVTSSKFVLGKLVDVEPDGQPDGLASRDDLSPAAAADDEDGVTFLTPLFSGQIAQVQVVASTRGLLDAWIDFNHANSWADRTDQIFSSVALSPGPNLLTFTVPAAALQGTTYARFRFSREGKLPHYGPGGLGEVEDYQVSIEREDRCDLGCAGRDFWLTFPGNYAPDPANPVKPSLCAIGAAGTTVRVEIPGLGFVVNPVIPAAGVLNIDLPKAADLGDAVDVIEKKGIHVTATADIALYGMSKVTFTSDGFLALATETLGTAYVVQSYQNVHGSVPELNGTQFAIVATENDTTVEFTLPVVTTPYDADEPYTFTLQAGETYQLRNTLGAPNDLSGTVIRSDKPVAVFGSHQCANVNSSDWFFCDYLVEQLVPVKRWNAEHITHPLATRLNGDAIRVLAAFNGTQVSVNGVPVVTLNRGEFYETTRSAATRFSANRPIHVTQYANSSDYDLRTEADPFMVQVPGTKQYNRSHVFCIPGTGFSSHYVNIVAPTGAVASVQLDGANVGASLTAIPGTPYASGSVKISAAGVRHTVTASQPVGVIVYGWNTYESYGYPACFFFGDTRPPVVTCPPPISVTVPIAGAALVCEAPVPDLRSLAKISDNCGLPTPGTVGIPGVFQDPAPGTRLPPGEYQITVSAVDANGNVGVCVTPFTVVDQNPDQSLRIVCPQDLNVRCQTSAGAVVEYEAYAMKGCTRLDLECLPPPGSVFPTGVTTVFCVLDGKVVCSFDVNVTCSQIGFVRFNNTLVLDWLPGTVLQRAQRLDGPWTDVPVTISNLVTLPFSNRQEFFRLRR